MQTCSNCNAFSPDSATNCGGCGAGLKESSTRSIALKRFQENSRVKYVRVITSDDACPACRELEGAYSKDSPPFLPPETCSHEHGCRCFYLPFLTDIYP
ncbi:MAG TPA: hypothetical protein VJ768_04675 [Anaerolineales bacterium]|nr:hypothetical protein [Anaerolineales bacterium]